MAQTVDGTILAGGFSITLSTTGSVIVNSYSIDRPGNSIIQTDANDEPNAAIHYDGLMTGSANIQVDDTGTQADVRGETFTTSDMTGESQVFIVTASNLSGSKNGLTTGDITFAEQLA